MNMAPDMGGRGETRFVALMQEWITSRKKHSDSNRCEIPVKTKPRLLQGV